MLGVVTVVAHFAVVEVEAQKDPGKDPRPSALGVSAAAKVTAGDSVCPL